MSLRKRIADSEAVNNWVARRIAGYLRWVYRSSDWQRDGYGPLEDALQAKDPVIVVLWHQRLMLSPFFFPMDLGRICSLTSSGRAGRMAGRMQMEFGMETIAMSSHKRHVALSREVLGKIRNGRSIGIAADGPRGPERICSTVPLVWARSSGARVFVISCATRKARTAATWDRMLLPAPYNEGVFMCREWAQTVPRKASAEQIEDLRLDLEGLLNDITAECDRRMGRVPYQTGS